MREEQNKNKMIEAANKTAAYFGSDEHGASYVLAVLSRFYKLGKEEGRYNTPDVVQPPFVPEDHT